MIKNLLNADEPASKVQDDKGVSTRSTDSVLNLFDASETTEAQKEREEFVISRAEPESPAETIRQTGLAWSAGIAFFAAVVFMLVLGWGADLLLGSSPWGIVGGIVIGSIIGFVQFFRTTSQIFKK